MAQRISGPTPQAGTMMKASRTLDTLPANLVFYEGFDHTTTPTLPAGWATFSLSGAGFVTGTAGDENGQANANGFWPVPPHGFFALANDDACNCDRSNDLLTSRAFNFSGYTQLALGFSAFQNGSNGQQAFVQVSSASQVWQTIFTIPASASWERYEVVVPPVLLEKDFRFRFKYSDNGKYASGLAMDDVYLSTTSAVPLKLLSFGVIEGNEQVAIPSNIPQVQARFADWQFGASAANQDATATTVKLHVEIAGNATYAQTTAAWPLENGTSDNLHFLRHQAFSPYVKGSYKIDYHLFSGSMDSVSNAGERTFMVTDSTYSHTPHSGNGSGIWMDDNLDRVGVVFSLFSSDTLRSVRINIHPITETSAQFRVKVFAFPFTASPVFTSDFVTVSQSDFGKFLRVAVNQPFGRGSYMVAIEKESGQLVIATNTNYPAPYGTAYYQPNGSSWRDLAYCPLLDLVFDTVNPPCVGSIQAVVHNESCAGFEDAQIQASLVGDVAGGYMWSTGATASTITNLAADTYNLTVTAGSGCIYTRSFVLKPSDSLIIVPIVSPDLCGSGVGSIAVSMTGGTAPYALLLNGQPTAQNVSALNAGSYTIAVTDVMGCMADTTVLVAATPVIGLSAGVTKPDCGIANGSLSVTANGGAGIFTYTWAHGANTAAISNLVSGIYTLTVADTAGCVVDTTLFLSDINAPVVSLVSLENNRCETTPDGSLTVQKTGGTGAVIYAWSNAATGSTVTGLASGTYTLTATDGGGCKTFGHFTVESEATALLLDLMEQGVFCHGTAAGAITALVNGGFPGYTYAWSNSHTTASISALEAGTYTLSVTDSLGCTASATTVLGMQPAFFFTLDSLRGDTNGVTTLDAAICLSTYGGTPPYTYQWSNGNTYEDLIGVDTGYYAVIITDQFGCVLTLEKYLSAVGVAKISHAAHAPVLFPNPARAGEQVTVLHSEPIIHLVITDPSGNTVATHPLPYHTTSFAVPSVREAGIYIVTLHTAQGGTHALKLAVF